MGRISRHPPTTNCAARTPVLDESLTHRAAHVNFNYDSILIMIAGAICPTRRQLTLTARWLTLCNRNVPCPVILSPHFRAKDLHCFSFWYRSTVPCVTCGSGISFGGSESERGHLKFLPCSGCSADLSCRSAALSFKSWRFSSLGKLVTSGVNPNRRPLEGAKSRGPTNQFPSTFPSTCRTLALKKDRVLL